MQKSFCVLFSLVVGIFFIRCTSTKNVNTSTQVSKPKTYINYSKSSFEEFIATAALQNKPVLVEFWASWCGPCLRMDKETYSDPTLGNYINNNFLIYKMDADSFDGLELAGKHSVQSFPSLLVLTPSGELKENITGFYLPATLEDILRKHAK